MTRQTKRKKHLNKIMSTLQGLEGPFNVPIQQFEKRMDFVNALLDAIEDYALKKRKEKGSEGTPASRMIGYYCDLWRDKYKMKSNPPVTRRLAGQMKSITDDLGEKKIQFLLKAFFSMPDAFLMKSRHSMTLFFVKLNEIAAFAETGDFMTRSESVKLDKGGAIESTLEKIERGDL